jgi:3-oxoacyl-[acyl-carrier-protein] synthase II
MADLRRGAVTRALVVAADARLYPEAMARYARLGALSRRNDDPPAACRPFAADRDGFVVGEAGAALVLESPATAAARNAVSYGRLAGAAVGNDAYHPTRERPGATGAVDVMVRALADAGLDPTAVDAVNAHGTGTRANDAAEATALHAVFDAHGGPPPVSAVKSQLGHTLMAAGLVETIAALIALRDGFLSPTLNLLTPDPACDLDAVPLHARPASPRVILKNAFGFGGHNAALVISAH